VARLGVLAVLLAGGGGGLAAGDLLPRTEDELVAMVRTAIDQRDLATFERLINWQGASPIKRRVVGFEVRHSLGRKVRSIALEPFPEDGLREAEARGTLAMNMPVTERLRVVYDEPPLENGALPTAIFLVGKQDDAYRIALMVRRQRN
jgi:hypothetical protein